MLRNGTSGDYTPGTGKKVGLAQQCSPIDGPLNLEHWNSLLDIDDFDRDYILSGVKYGFKLFEQDSSTLTDVQCNNYSSCDMYQDLVENQIRHEIIHGNYVVSDTKPLLVSALGTISKSSSKIRLIHDASRPYMDLREAINHPMMFHG